MNKAVVACLTVEDLSAIHQISRSGETDVIAVVFDFGHGVALRELHEAALGAGAQRCHALDAGEEFARECVLPAVHAQSLRDAFDEVHARAQAFVAKKLSSVALLEGEAEVIFSGRLPFASSATASPLTPEYSALVTIGFENGLPISLNDVPMSLVEVLDSLRTIAGAHAITGPDAALQALHTAQRARVPADGRRTASVRLEMSRGSMTAVQPEYTTT